MLREVNKHLQRTIGQCELELGSLTSTIPEKRLNDVTGGVNISAEVGTAPSGLAEQNIDTSQ